MTRTVRYAILLTVIVMVTEYLVMIFFHVTGFEGTLPEEVESLLDALLLLLVSSIPIYHLIIKPILKLADEKQARLEYLLDALQGAGDAIVITDKNGTILFVNDSFTTITGYSAQEAIGNNPRILSSGVQDRAFYTTMWQTIADSGEWMGEVVNKRKNGDLFTEMLHIKARCDSVGSVVAYIGNIRDISSAKKKEMALRQAQKLESLGTLVGGVAHNFNNMLAGILGKAYLAKLKSNQPEVICQLDDIETISTDAAKIVKQLLSFAHKDVDIKQNTPITLLLKEAVKTARLGIREDVKVSTDFTNESLVVYCDPVEIQQVIMNLINNARDAIEISQQPEIHISIDRKPKNGCSRMGHAKSAMQKWPI